MVATGVTRGDSQVLREAGLLPGQAHKIPRGLTDARTAGQATGSGHWLPLPTGDHCPAKPRASCLSLSALAQGEPPASRPPAPELRSFRDALGT